MEKLTLRIDGMMCAMCESHVNEAVRRAIPVKKVTSSHVRGETVILAETGIDEEALRAAIDRTGYRVREARALGEKGALRAALEGQREDKKPWSLSAIRRCPASLGWRPSGMYFSRSAGTAGCMPETRKRSSTGMP